MSFKTPHFLKQIKIRLYTTIIRPMLKKSFEDQYHRVKIEDLKIKYGERFETRLWMRVQGSGQKK